MPAFIVADAGSTATRIRDVLNFGGLDCPTLVADSCNTREDGGLARGLAKGTVR